MSKSLAIAFMAIFLLQQPQTTHGRIEGNVLLAGSTEPISGAKVTVTRVNAVTAADIPTAGTVSTRILSLSPNAELPMLPPPGGGPGGLPPGSPQLFPIPSVTSDAAGKFTVPDLEEGVYRVRVTLNGYVRQEYGQRSFSAQGTPLTLGRGEVLKGLVVHLTRAGNVSGRIFDDAGQPAVGVPLQLVKAGYNQAGMRTFQNVGTAGTNDRGEYRLYWITPGRYYLAAGTPQGPVSGPPPSREGGPAPNETMDTYAFTYYPGTTDLARAIALEVQAGSELPVDLRVMRQQFYRVSGRIVGANTGPLPLAVAVSLAYQTMTGGSGYFLLSQTYDPATGNFAMLNVIPGSYALQANAGAMTARAPVEVVNADVSNIALVLNGGINIAGRVQLEGGGRALPAAPTRIQLRPIIKGVSNFAGFAPAAQANGADGSFTLDRVLAGEYRATVTPPSGYFVKDIRFERRDALNSAIDLSDSGPSSPSLEVLLSSSVGQIDGVITNDKLQPMSGVQAVLVPDVNRERPELYKAASTDQSGRFKMRDVAPGDYKLFAWEALENFGYFDPDVIRRAEPFGKAVRVDESAKLDVDTRTIPENSR